MAVLTSGVLAARLEAFCERQYLLPWQWGMVDCSMTPADWVFEITGKDPAGAWRGAYDDAESCHRLIRAEGGFIPMLGHRMDTLGFTRTGKPSLGDVGVISVPVMVAGHSLGVGPVSAIRGNDLWIVRATRGLHFQDFPPITAWSIC